MANISLSSQKEQSELRELQGLLQANGTPQKHVCMPEWHSERGENSDGLSAAATSIMSNTTSNNISPHNELADFNEEEDELAFDPRLRSRCCTPEQVVEEHSFDLIESPDDTVGRVALFEESSGQSGHASLVAMRSKKKKRRSNRV
jgi:hypothetical protein